MKISKELQATLEEAAKGDAYWVERAKLDFAIGLESQRRKAGLNYKQMADRLHSSAAYISKVFRGDSNLTIESMVKLARASGGCLEVRIVSPAETLNSWTSGAIPKQPLRRPLIAEVSDTLAQEVTETTNVCWADDFFKRAA